MRARAGVRAAVRGVAAVAGAVAAVALLGGCGGGAKDTAGPAPSASTSVTAAASARATATVTVEPPAASSPGIGPDGTAETGPAATAGPATTQPTVPRSQLTPATGTFTDRQKDYLVGKVPRGMDPAAVLQTGQESCERIAGTAAASPALARQAIRDGEIADARDAITYLCPKFEILLD